jgi:hypothetical protein
MGQFSPGPRCPLRAKGKDDTNPPIKIIVRRIDILTDEKRRFVVLLVLLATLVLRSATPHRLPLKNISHRPDN